MQIIQSSVIDNIKVNFDSLFPAEKKVAQYILEHLNEVIFLNISELATPVFRGLHHECLEAVLRKS